MTGEPKPVPLFLDRNLRVIFGVTLMAMLGVSSVTPAFPLVAAALDVTPQQVGLLISVFTVPGVLLAPLLGVLADRYGRKIILVPSLFLFGLAGASCGIARDFGVLVGLRLLQGVGGAALGAINVTVIGDLFDGDRRTTAMGYNAAVLSIGTATYPAIGGALAMLAWYAPFFLPILAVPVGVVVLVVLESPGPGAQSDLRAYLRNAIGLMSRRQVLMMFAAGVVTFVLIYGAYLSYLPFVLERRFAASALGIGVVFSAASVATAVASFSLGRLARRFGEHRLVTAAFVLYAFSLGLMPHAGSLALMVLLVMCFGTANGLGIPSILTIIAGSTPDEYRAVFMSVNGMLIRLGQTLGPLVAGVAYATAGLAPAFWLSAGLAAVMVPVVASGRRE